MFLIVKLSTFALVFLMWSCPFKFPCNFPEAMKSVSVCLFSGEGLAPILFEACTMSRSSIEEVEDLHALGACVCSSEEESFGDWFDEEMSRCQARSDGIDIDGMYGHMHPDELASEDDLAAIIESGIVLGDHEASLPGDEYPAPDPPLQDGHDAQDEIS